MKKYIIVAGFKNGDVLCAIEYNVIDGKMVLDTDQVLEADKDFEILKTEEDVTKYFAI